MVGVPEWLPIQRVLVAIAFLAAGAVVWHLDRPLGRWGRRLRSRFLLGLPWGTLVSGGLVLLFYLLVQGGLDSWYRPLVVPFTAWSYFYPLGVLTAAFAHAGPGHLVGNLVGTLTFGALAEYAVGHYPRRRGASSFGSPLTNPYVRAFVLFPAGVFGVGLLTSVFGLGPVVGFSGVVFAFAGFAVVHYPLAAVVALVAGRVLRLAYRAILYPVSTATSEPSFSTPWFADVAVQGHAFGFLCGALLGIWLASRRDDPRPSSLRVFAGALLFAVAQSMWAVYWFRGDGTFVLYRAGGVALIVLLAALVTAAATAEGRGLLRDVAGSPGRHLVRGSLGSLTSRQLAVTVLLVSTAAVAGPAAGVNALIVADYDEADDRGVAVRDYHVTYAEDVENDMVSVVAVEAFGESTAVNTSGVIVQSRERNVWFTAVSKDRLAFAGSVQIKVGGLGWERTVVAARQGWEPVGTDPVYRVTLTTGGESFPVYASESRQSESVIDGRNVSLVAEPERFLVAVERRDGDGRATEPLPAQNESVVVDGIALVREEQKLYAERGDTRVRIATRETYD